jgi:hypothetical protein
VDTEESNDIGMSTVLQDLAALLEILHLPGRGLDELVVEILSSTGKIEELGLADNGTIAIHEDLIVVYVYTTWINVW